MNGINNRETSGYNHNYSSTIRMKWVVPFVIPLLHSISNSLDIGSTSNEPHWSLRMKSHACGNKHNPERKENQTHLAGQLTWNLFNPLTFLQRSRSHFPCLQHNPYTKDTRKTTIIVGLILPNPILSHPKATTLTNHLTKTLNQNTPI